MTVKPFLISLLFFVFFTTATLAQNIDINKIKTEAKNGSPDAQYKMGIFYFYGQNSKIKKNVSGANEYFKKAFVGFLKLAESGDTHAQHTLGIMCKHGFGTTKNKIEAGKWFTIAHRKGNKLSLDFKRENEMTLGAKQISEINKRADEWIQKH